MTDTVYLDSQGHLWSADRDALHRMAAVIGLRREWFQDRPRLYHYDVMTASKRRRALKAGAVLVHPRDLVGLIQRNDRRSA